MQTHDALLRYFLTGTAEEDRTFLERAFITHDQMTTMLSIDPGAMRILAGSKGIGKTAFFEWLVRIAQRRNLPAILLRPDDLDAKGIGASADIGTLKRGFYEALVTSVATALGRQLKVSSPATLRNSTPRQLEVAHVTPISWVRCWRSFPLFPSRSPRLMVSSSLRILPVA